MVSCDISGYLLSGLKLGRSGVGSGRGLLGSWCSGGSLGGCADQSIQHTAGNTAIVECCIVISHEQYWHAAADWTYLNCLLE